MPQMGTDKIARKRANMQQREDDQEEKRLVAVANYKSGALKPTFSVSPDSRARARLESCAAFMSEQPESAHLEAAERQELGDGDNDLNGLPNLDGSVRFQSSETSDSEMEVVELSSSDSENENLNPSGQEAKELAKKRIELSTISAEEIWALFTNSKFRGGMLARTLFITAKAVQPDECSPWRGSTKLGTKKSEVADQRSSFLMWANEDPYVLNWIRLEVYKIVSLKPHTYKNFTATHATAPKYSQTHSGKTLESEQASDDAMARVAHLVCHPDSRLVLNMLFGSKDRYIVDNRDLQSDQLWQDLATVYVNNPSWEIEQMSVPQLQEIDPKNAKAFISKIDITNVPVVGLSGDCVREVFSKLKKMFEDVANPVFGKTGVNAIGEEFYGRVWTNYINGHLLFFPRKAVAMYVFKLWAETNNIDALPKYCIKLLRAEAQLRLGVFKESSKRNYVLPVTPRSSSSSNPFGSPGSSSSQTTIQESIASYIQYQIAKDDRDGKAAPMLLAPKPNDDFEALLTKHDLLSVWDSSTSWFLCFYDVHIHNTYLKFSCILNQQSIPTSMLEPSKSSAS